MASPVHHAVTGTWTGNGHTPDPELLARAAAVLGVDAPAVDGPATTGPASSAQLMVTLVGPGRREVRQVPADVPVGRLAPMLGAAVGVDAVAAVSLRGGRTISPSQTLAEAGVRNASVIVIGAPGAPARSFPGKAQQVRTATRGARLPLNARGTHRERSGPSRWLVLGPGLAAVVVISAFVGAAIGGAGSPSTNSPTAADGLAARAASAWLAGKPFHGPRLAGVPADLGRVGPALGGSLQAVSSSTSGQITQVAFIASPPDGRPFGLGVVVYHDQIAYPPSVTPLPFVTSITAGQSNPTVPQTGTIVTPTAGRQALAWAKRTFPVMSPWRLAGRVKVLNQWRPTHGAALVTRVQVPLRGAPAGSTVLASLTKAQSELRSAQGTVAAAGKTLQDASVTVSADRAAIGQANTALTNAQAAAAAGQNTPPLAAAVTAAQANLTKAQQALSTDQATQAADQAGLTSGRQAEAAARAGLAHAEAALTSVTSVYDVAYDHAGTPIAWGPADYQIGGTP